MNAAQHTSKPPAIRWLGRCAFLASATYVYLLAALGALAILVPLATGMRSTVLMSDSMARSLAAGDVVLIEGHNGEGLGNGTVVMFRDMAQPGRHITHRIVGVNRDGSYQTAGDANAQPDSTPVFPHQVVGVGRAVVPSIGLPALWLRTGRPIEFATFLLITVVAYVCTRRYEQWDAAGSMPRDSGVDAGAAADDQIKEAGEAGSEAAAKAFAGHRMGLLVPMLAVTVVALGVGSAEASFQSTTSNAGNSLAAAASFNTIEFVQTVGSASCGGTSSIISVPVGGVPVGDTILVRVALRNSSAAVPVAATDSVGNTYTVDADVVSGNRIRAVVLSAHVDFALATSDTIVVTHADGRAESAVVEQFSGIAAVGRVEATGTGTGNSATPSASLASGGGEVLLYGVVANWGNVTHTEAVGWTSVALVAVQCNRRMDNAAGYMIVDVAGPYTYATTLSANRRWAESLVAYRAE